MATLLQLRFGERASITRLIGAHATRGAVTRRLADVAESAAGGDLLVVLFVGHGYRGDGEQGWKLYDRDLSGRDLASRVGAIADGVELLVISDCCYGGGIAEAMLAASQTRPCGALWPLVVCAASANREEHTHVCSEFLPQLCESIDSAATYRELTQRMTNPSRQSTWTVVGIPDSALDLLPFARR